MSGAGRKHRAKHLTQQYLDATGWVGPKDGESLAVCLESPQAQHVRVLLLLAHPATVTAANHSAEAVTDSSASPTASGGGGSSSNGDNGGVTEPTDAVLEKEQLAFLPGKFHKVIWLSIKDIVVVSDGTVTFKPSPEQIENFLKNPAHDGWRERIAAAQQKAEDQRVAVQRMPQYGAATQTTTSVLTGPQVHREARGNEDADEDAEDAMDDLVNPNWRNIKHHQQYFYGMEDDSDDEAEEDEESEDEEEEQQEAKK